MDIALLAVFGFWATFAFSANVIVKSANTKTNLKLNAIFEEI